MIEQTQRHVNQNDSNVDMMDEDVQPSTTAYDFITTMNEETQPFVNQNHFIEEIEMFVDDNGFVIVTDLDAKPSVEQDNSVVDIDIVDEDTELVVDENESKASTFRHESFKRFLDLPLELQYTVWDLLLPTRAVDVVIPTQVGPLVEGMCWQIHTAMSNERPPLIAAVSHSVRDYVRSQCWWNYNEPDGSLPTRPESILDGFSPKPLPDNFSPEEFLARGPGFWYKPKRDIPVLYHTGEPLVSVQDLLHSCVEKYGWAAKETAVYAPGAHPWPVDYNNMIQLDRGLAAMPPNPPHGWNDPLVVMESITVHATNESALQSELFGLMGDAPVQLIDPRDTELLVKYQKFMNKAESDGIDQDPKARGWLDRFINRPWAVGLEDCKQHYQTIEVWRLWLQGQKANFEDIPNPVDIWDGPRVHDDRTLDMLDPETYSLFEWEEDDGGYWVDVTTFRPNEAPMGARNPGMSASLSASRDDPALCQPRLCRARVS